MTKVKELNNDILADTAVESVSVIELKAMLDRNMSKGVKPFLVTVEGSRLEFRVVNVTPSIARTLLTRNQNNRPLKNTQITKYALSMEKGEWNFDATPLNFDIYGNLLNGQHRLNAIVKSGITIPMLIAIGFSPKIFTTMDIGRVRTFAEILAIAGIDNYQLCASSSDFIYRMKLGIYGNAKSTKKGVSNAISNEELLKFVEKSPLISESISFYENLKRNGKIPMNIMQPFMVTGLYYLFSEKSKEEANIFITKLLVGEGLEVDSPIFHLRNKLVSAKIDKNSSTRSRLYKTEMVKLTINAWNKFRNNEKVKALKIPEQFPKIN